eukprot:CAMPEP_0115158052 /NCGR_PEP_ID=MMETSP0227-20121206/69370_1 /TAXON_ID=89957 /ORGANISM="Polarella glacialis, Strain CCMP 1383" /LENGTH=53 /DNA_ID=CAMNT_0002569465 /DNA_START=458 /DNA_END=619 /DNA_ORIENTATION=+
MRAVRAPSQSVKNPMGPSAQATFEAPSAPDDSEQTSEAPTLLVLLACLLASKA